MCAVTRGYIALVTMATICDDDTVDLANIAAL
jgi:hypothetical protein